MVQSGTAIDRRSAEQRVRSHGRNLVAGTGGVKISRSTDGCLGMRHSRTAGTSIAMPPARHQIGFELDLL